MAVPTRSCPHVAQQHSVPAGMDIACIGVQGALSVYSVCTRASISL